MATIRIIKIAGSLAIIVAALCLFPGPRRTSICDFAAYWTGSRLMMARHNPYDWNAVIALERPFGVNELNPLIVRNPPWALPLMLPLGLMSYAVGRIVWLLLQTLLTIWSIRLLYQMYGGGREFTRAAWMAVAIFTPLYIALAIGQLTPVVLLGIAGFLYAQQKQQDTLAGACLFLAALKPHLLFLVWPILVVWVVTTKRWRILVTFIVLLSAASAIPLLFDPMVFQHYSELWVLSPVLWSQASNFSGTLCRLFGASKLVAFSLSFFSLIWAGFYWLKNRQHWSWLREIPLLLLVSIMASPYSWFFDQMILLPALIHALGVRYPAKRRSILLFVLYICVNLSVIGFEAAGKDSLWYSWTGPVWLVLYVAALYEKKIPMRLPQEVSISS